MTSRMVRRTLRQILVGLLLVAFSSILGCGSAVHSTQPGTNPDKLEPEVKNLRQQQLDLLYDFDNVMNTQGKQCKELCGHHTQICKLATRICEISKTNPSHYKADAACKQATATCRDTNQRLPEECWCRS